MKFRPVANRKQLVGGKSSFVDEWDGEEEAAKLSRSCEIQMAIRELVKSLLRVLLRTLCSAKTKQSEVLKTN